MTQSTYNNPESERTRNLREDVNYDDDTTFEDPRIARERAEERERAEARDGVRVQAEQASHDDAQKLGTSYLSDRSTEEPWQQWRSIQSDFVDNPRTAVSNAHGLVGELINDIVHKFENEKTELEHRWSSGEDVSTEDLRKCLQTYRDFFGRLLASSDAKA